MTTIRLNGTSRSFKTSEEARSYIIKEGKKAQLRAEMAKTDADKLRHLKEARNLFNWAKADAQMDKTLFGPRRTSRYETH